MRGCRVLARPARRRAGRQLPFSSNYRSPEAATGVFLSLLLSRRRGCDVVIGVGGHGDVPLALELFEALGQRVVNEGVGVGAE
jgi:hypothetical protein